jgi:hypothetical protein
MKAAAAGAANSASAISRSITWLWWWHMAIICVETLIAPVSVAE